MRLHPAGRRTAIRHAVLAAALAALAAPLPARADWPHNPYTNLPVCTATGSQTSIRVTSDGRGGTYVVWVDDRAGSATDIYAQHVLASGGVDPAWPATGLAVCTATGTQYYPDLARDGSGGLFVVWQDTRSGTTSDVYVQHALANGTLDPAWPAQGRPAATSTLGQYSPRVVIDGAGGVFVAWHGGGVSTGNDVWAAHVLASGAPDPAWPATGLPVSVQPGLQSFPDIALVAPGVAVITWRDTRGATWDVYAQRVLAGTGVDPAWPTDGRALCTATGQQDTPIVTGDGAGGAIVAWRDARNGAGTDLYAQHVLANGTVDTGWPVDGRAVCLATDNQQYAQIVGDDAGGAIVTWEDHRSAGTGDIYAQHVLASGIADPAWPIDGRAVCTAIFDQGYPVLAADGAGGAVIAWQDNRSGYEIYAQHVLANGANDPTWPPDGRAVSTAANAQYYPQMAADGAGGVVLAWWDARPGVATDVYAQRVARFGQLGSPEPGLVAVADVPNDQGGQVKLSWTASWLDVESSSAVTAYDVLRSVPSSLAAARRAAGARVIADLSGVNAPGDLLAIVTGGATTYWELLASVPALHYVTGYSFVAPTTGDSLPGSNPLTSFMVVARDDARTRYWLSAAMSGYSVDDLAPAAPAPLTGAYAAGTTRLHWDPNAEADLAGYRLYRGASADFAPGPQSLVAALADTGYADAAGAPAFYKLTAVDVHGNESPVALLSPSGTLDVGDGATAAALALAAPSPNPARGSSVMRFALPRSGRVRLAVHDLSGRVVRTLADGTGEAGEHSLAWDLRDDAGNAVRPGLYFVRLESAGESRARSMAVLR